MNVLQLTKGRLLAGGGAAALLLMAILASCATTPPGNREDVCAIFMEKRGWYHAAMQSFEKWGVPVHVQMAIIYQESRFEPRARPPRKRFLGFIPTTRPTTAYGYAQVKDATWEWYQSKTGHHGADRDDFADAVDFIGWYGRYSHSHLGISKWDAYNQYLAYHEGHGGYKQKSYAKKPWLLAAARKVEANAKRYSRQLAGCREELEHRRYWFWPF
ncbi:MAG TPA: hypothetical protein ENJ22_05265 [Gammaproteobacteria bacterium]|nr:hypothetical protein [Gammaproteobacteria bacterium]